MCVEGEGCVCGERGTSTGCQSSSGHSLSLLDRARPGENGSPWDPEKRKEEEMQEGRWREQGGDDCLSR